MKKAPPQAAAGAPRRRPPGADASVLRESDNLELERRVEERTAQLEREKRHLAGIIAGTDDGTWEWDLRADELRPNERWARMIGYGLDELAPLNSRTSIDLIHPEDRPEAEARMQEHLRGRTDRYDCEIRLRHKNGGWVWVRDRGRVVERAPDGRPLRMFGTHTDITPRKRVEEALKTSQANFQSFFDLSMEFLFVLDERGSILKANRCVYDRLGYTEEEILGISVLQVHPPDVREEAARIVQAMLAGEKDVCPLPLQAKDGRRIAVETRIVAGRWDGQPALFGVSKDVSDLALSEDKFSNAFELSPTLLAISELGTGRFVDVNRAFLSTLGYTREDVIGRTSRDLGLFPDISIRDAAAGEAVKSGGSFRELKLSVRDSAGAMHVGEFSSQILSGAKGPDLLLTVMNDVTEREKADQEIKRQAALISSLLDSIPDIVFFKDARGAYLACNPPFAELVDRRREEIIGRTDEQLFSAEAAAFFREQDRLMLESGQPRRNEEWITYPNGRKVLLDTLKTPYRSGAGSTIGVLGISRDITERKRAEDDLRDLSERLRRGVQEAEEASRAKSVFLANMSHEIRTPMSGVLGMIGLLLETPLTESQRNYVHKIKTSGESLLAVLNDILDYSKIEAGKLILESIPFSLEELVRNVVSVFGLQAVEKGLELQADIDPALPPAFLGDPKRLTQLLNNLTGNAVKFTPAGEIYLAVAGGRRTESGMELEFSLRDTGIGMTPEEMSRLFTPFSQADASTTRRFGGSGLGLAISRQIVEVMGGSLRAESTPGRGSIFTATIPLHVAPTDGSERSPDPEWREKRALVVDDSPLARRGAAKILASWAFRVRESGSGEEALALLRRADEEGRPFDLCLLDRSMPVLGGIETARRIRAAALSRQPGLLLLTANDAPETCGGAVEAGLSACVGKPVFASSLFAAVRSLFGAPEARSRSGSSRARPRFPGVRALLAEDHDINREILEGMLTSAGVAIDIVKNGREALEMVRTRDYDIVFMDVQMPEMDGFTATREIRRLASPGGRRVPILAMTAHALIGDREKSLAAGMDDHLTKPIDQAVLFEALRKWLPKEKAGSGPADSGNPFPAPNPPAFPAVLDLEAGLRLLDGNSGLYHKLLGKFASEFGAAPARLEEALGGNRRTEAALLAHSIKGLAGNLGGMDLHAAAGELERICRAPAEGGFSFEEAALRRFTVSHEKMMAAVGSARDRLAPPVPASSPGPPGSPEDLRAGLRELRAALADEEPLPCRTILQELDRKIWPKSQADVLQELDRLIGCFRLADAAALIERELAGALDETEGPAGA